QHSLPLRPLSLPRAPATAGSSTHSRPLSWRAGAEGNMPLPIPPLRPLASPPTGATAANANAGASSLHPNVAALLRAEFARLAASQRAEVEAEAQRRAATTRPRNDAGGAAAAGDAVEPTCAAAVAAPAARDSEPAAAGFDAASPSPATASDSQPETLLT